MLASQKHGPVCSKRAASDAVIYAYAQAAHYFFVHILGRPQVEFATLAVQQEEHALFSIRHVYRRLDDAVEHTVQIQQRRDRPPNRVDGVQFLELALKLLRELIPFLMHSGGSESALDRFLHLLRIERLDDVVARSQPEGLHDHFGRLADGSEDDRDVYVPLL